MAKKTKTTLKARLLRLGILSAAIMGLIMTVVATLLYYLEIVNNSEDFDTNVVSNASETIGEEVDFIGKSLTAAEISDEGDNVFNRVFVNGSDTGYDYSFFKDECTNIPAGELYISKEIDNGSGSMIVLAACKGSDGVIKLGEIDIDYFAYILKTFAGDTDSAGYVINRNGIVIMTGGKDFIPVGTDIKTLGVGDVIEKTANGESGNFVLGGSLTNGSRYIYSYAPVENSSFSILYVSNYEAVVIKYYQLLIILIVTYLLLLCVGIYFSIATAKRVSAPISAVTDRLSSLSRGDVSTRFKALKTNDETQVLAEAMLDTIDNLSAYIGDIQQVLMKISEGDLTAKSEVVYAGDFMALGDSIEKITNSLSSTMETIQEAGNQFASGSSSVAAGAKALADNSVEEAATLENLNSKVSSIKDAIDNTSENMNRANELSKAVQNNVVEGSRNMAEMSVAVQNIKEASDKIQAVVKLINDIAFQTNILALNAAVEAARAGEAGKGFAVVADEVRNLAAKSADAVKNTVVLVGECSNAVKQGAVLTESANSSFNDIEKSMNEFGGLIAGIAAATNNQTSAIQEINAGIEAMSDSVTSNSATAEESAAASDQLNEQASLLAERIGFFKIN